MSLNQIKVDCYSHWGDDWEIAHFGWASTYDRQKAEAFDEERVRKILGEVLIPGGHNSPLESVWFKFYIEIPIFVERQLDKYRVSVQAQCYDHGSFGRLGISQNELSGRYRTIPANIYDLPEDIRDIANKVLPTTDMGTGYNEMYDNHMMNQHGWYREFIREFREAMEAGKITNKEYKRWREVHRGILGTSTFTQLRLVVNLHSLVGIWRQRLSHDAQNETGHTAKLMLQGVQARGNIPIALDLLAKKYNWEEYLCGSTE